MTDPTPIDAGRYPLLSRIDSPADLRKLPESELRAVADELRAYLIESVGQSGGHFGAGLGVDGPVISPTFVLSRVHRARSGGPGLVHVDAYRLGGLDDLDALDLDTDLDDSVVVVEWGEGVVERLVDEYLIVRMRRDDDSETRHATWEWVNR